MKPALFREVVLKMIGLILLSKIRSRALLITEVIAIGLVVLKHGSLVLYLSIFLAHCIRKSLPVWCKCSLSSVWKHFLSRETPALE